MSPYLLIKKKNTNETYVTQHLHVCLVFSHVKEKERGGRKDGVMLMKERERRTQTKSGIDQR